MISRSRSRVGLSVLAVAVAVIAVGCSNSSSPTTPVATESGALQVSASASSEGGNIATQWVFEFDAVALEDPQLITADREQYIRVVVSCQPISGGSEETAVFRFFGNLMQEGAGLSKGSTFFAKVKQDGEDGRDWSIPAYRVLKIRVSGATS